MFTFDIFLIKNPREIIFVVFLQILAYFWQKRESKAIIRLDLEPGPQEPSVTHRLFSVWPEESPLASQDAGSPPPQGI